MPFATPHFFRKKLILSNLKRDKIIKKLGYHLEEYPLILPNWGWFELPKRIPIHDRNVINVLITSLISLMRIHMLSQAPHSQKDSTRINSSNCARGLMITFKSRSDGLS